MSSNALCIFSGVPHAADNYLAEASRRLRLDNLSTECLHMPGQCLRDPIGYALKSRECAGVDIHVDDFPSSGNNCANCRFSKFFELGLNPKGQKTQ